MLAKAYAKPRGVFRDYDKNVEDLTVEGKYFATSYLIRCWLLLTPPFRGFLLLAVF